MPDLVVRDALALLRGELTPSLRDALATLPGIARPGPGCSWSLRLGPDRAYSLALIADALEDELSIDQLSRSNLELLAADRDALDPVVELVSRADGERSLSLLDDWQSLGVEELRSVPGATARRESGRTEVPLTPWTAEAIDRTVRAHAIRLSPGAELALRETLAAPPASPAPPTSEASSRPADEGEHVVDLEPGGAHVRLRAAPTGPLAPALASLPDARLLSPGSWLVTATPELARRLRDLGAEHDELTASPEAERWLREAPRWIARVDVDHGAEPRIRITSRWGEAPADLLEIPGVEAAPDQHRLPLEGAALRSLAAIVEREREVSLAPDAARTLAWVEDNPGAEEVPGAELDVIFDGDGERLALETVWDDASEGEFLAQEAALLRTHRARSPRAEALPADEWPTDVLARFIRIRRIRASPAVERLFGVEGDDADAARLLALSKAHDAELEVEGLGGELMPFQRAGVAYALERRRCFLADEQGLGKTIQALAAVQADLAYPAVVVCPASLKLNWLREIERWLPDRSAIALSGRSTAQLEDAAIVVLNYEIVAAHRERLARMEPRALILDESHYVKNPRARRTQAVLELSSCLGRDALRLALTGTPVVNRPEELASQLRAIERLAEYGSAASFKRAYVTPIQRRRLHERLRSSCFMRRRKKEVLGQLPSKARAVVTMPLDNEREYRLAERDFVRWLREQLAERDLDQDLRANALVKLSALRQLAARGKLTAALSWIEDFRASEEKLVVFAHHREIQEEIFERFPESARISGADPVDVREENVRRFQSADGPDLCVCSLEVGSLGLTLTAAANVAFLELGWNPAKHDQAEDRLHRIGQDRSVTAWYLLAAETIDERMAELIESKRGVVDSLTDGGAGAGGSSIAGALIGEYARAA